MKASEIKTTIERVRTELDQVNAMRDELTLKARTLSASVADLEAKQKLLELPPSPIKAKVLAAAGIESSEAFGNG